MAVSTVSLCCFFLLGAVCLTNASSTAPAVRDGDTLNRAVMAAKYLYDTLSAEQEAVVMVEKCCCRNCRRCPDETGTCKISDVKWCERCAC